jgi:hypothetical protein
MSKSTLTRFISSTLALLGLMIVTSACSFNFGRGGARATDLSSAKPGDKVILSETVNLDIIPSSVIPYGSKPAIQFSNLQLTKGGDFVQGEVDFTRNNRGDFVLVAVLSLDKEILFAYFDPDTDLNVHLPSGTVLFGIRGCEISGADSGKIEFALTGRIFNGYSVFGEKATAFVFAVPGKVNPQSALPGDQRDPETFLANSNVLEVELDLR